MRSLRLLRGDGRAGKAGIFSEGDSGGTGVGTSTPLLDHGVGVGGVGGGTPLLDHGEPGKEKEEGVGGVGGVGGGTLLLDHGELGREKEEGVGGVGGVGGDRHGGEHASAVELVPGGDEEASATDTEEASATDTKDSTTAKGTPAEPATATNSTDDAVPSLRRSHGDPQGGSRREVLGMPGFPGLPRDPGILESECVQPDRRGEGQSGQCLDEHGT